MKIFKQPFLLFFFIVYFSSQIEGAVEIDLKNFSKAPKFLSEFGFFEDMQNQIPAESCLLSTSPSQRASA